ncbi:hypothetical protein [Rhodococcus sp. IEGM 1318]|uniref:hypothetical protein n=1 Tax=Rhodococcus sp. IEGM 1318 TaxID=3082226 RepID=UPI002955C04A|nr:hypothetical protein [Rhodococcus sp. IEGM 1318]MDV8009242.1 hypothetical protein [Rhodococcus sp. IEGM 1318]
MEALELLTSVSSPAGEERLLAESIVSWGMSQFPHLRWELIEGDGEHSSSVLVTASRDAETGGLLLYSHLDTSLFGDLVVDRPILGDVVRDECFQLDGASRIVSGLGLGVAKGPAAAALTAFVLAAEKVSDMSGPYRLQLLLAAGGTHRTLESAFDSPSRRRTGVTEYLAAQSHPRHVIVAKAGPRGVLYDEPGALYFRVRLSGEWGPVMWRATNSPEGGVLRHCGLIIEAIEEWGRGYVDSAEAGEQCGAEVGLGAIRGGIKAKPDLIPAVVELYGYLVHPGEIDAVIIRESLGGYLRSSIRGTALDLECVRIDVDIVHIDQGAATPRLSAIVRSAERHWQTVKSDDLPVISRWKGSTDGVVFRAAGIDTARVGPFISLPSPDGVDRISLDEMLDCVDIYERIAVDTARR